jgi:tRNA (uracil-5-)-methyltransferase
MVGASTDAELSWLAFQPHRYWELLEDHVAAVKQTFAAALSRRGVTPEVFASSPSHYRQRARFSIARFDPDGSVSAPGSKSGRLRYALYDKGACMARPDVFPVAAESICELMPRLLAALETNSVLWESLEAVHYLSTQVGDMHVTLIYSSPLADGWRAVAAAMGLQLGIPALTGRSRGRVEVIVRDWVTEVYTLADGRMLTYRQVAGSFSNPSSAMAEHTLNFLCSCSKAIGAEVAAASGELPALLELYCGNGNHTVALAPLFRAVLAVEIDRKLTVAAEDNLKRNGVNNAHVLCATSGRFCQSLMRKIIALKSELQGVATSCGGAGGGSRGGAGGQVGGGTPGSASTAGAAPSSVQKDAFSSRVNKSVKEEDALLEDEAEEDCVPPHHATTDGSSRADRCCSHACSRPGQRRPSAGPTSTFEEARRAWLREAGARCDVVLIDPPRCGPDESALPCVWRGCGRGGWITLKTM